MLWALIAGILNGMLLFLAEASSAGQPYILVSSAGYEHPE